MTTESRDGREPNDPRLEAGPRPAPPRRPAIDLDLRLSTGVASRAHAGLSDPSGRSGAAT